MATATKKQPTLRSAYSKKRRYSIDLSEGNGAKQSFKTECDINFIMAKFTKTGTIEHVNKHQASYGFASSHDLKESMAQIQTASDMFDELPAKLRAKFNNSPGEFLDFVQDEANLDEMHELGLTNTKTPTATNVAPADTQEEETSPPAKPAPTKS